MYYPLQIGSSYNFTLYASGVLGVGYENAKVEGIMDYNTAKTVQDIVPLHIQAYPSLPNGSVRNAQLLTYVKIKTISGESRVIAMDWISSTPVLVVTQSVKVTIANVVSSDVARIKDVLIANGFTSLEVEILT